MKVHDLVSVYGDPICGTHYVPEGVLGVIVEIQGVHIIVQFGNDEIRYMYRMSDVVSIDTSDIGLANASH